jgi:hypothetical protein
MQKEWHRSNYCQQHWHITFLIKYVPHSTKAVGRPSSINICSYLTYILRNSEFHFANLSAFLYIYFLPKTEQMQKKKHKEHVQWWCKFHGNLIQYNKLPSGNATNFLTWNVFPSPMQWARMQPEPFVFSICFNDSKQTSHINFTPFTWNEKNWLTTWHTDLLRKPKFLISPTKSSYHHNMKCLYCICKEPNWIANIPLSQHFVIINTDILWLYVSSCCISIRP